MSTELQEVEFIGKFVTHTEGPDDIEYFETWAEACIHAQAINAEIVEYNTRSLMPGEIRAWAIPYLTADHEARWNLILGAGA